MYFILEILNLSIKVAFVISYTKFHMCFFLMISGKVLWHSITNCYVYINIYIILFSQSLGQTRWQ